MYRSSPSPFPHSVSSLLTVLLIEKCQEEAIVRSMRAIFFVRKFQSQKPNTTRNSVETVSKWIDPIFDLDLFVRSAASSTEELERSYDAPIGEWFINVNSVVSNNANRKYGGVACLAVVDHLAKRARYASAILTRLKRLSLPKFRV